jgi:hypothetical protein
MVLYVHVSFRGWKIGSSVDVVQRRSLIPDMNINSNDKIIIVIVIIINIIIILSCDISDT